MGVSNSFTIKNKDARSKVYVKHKKEKAKHKREERKERDEKGLPKQVPETIDSKREFDETIKIEEAEDETNGFDFSHYFKTEGKDPKILITTNANCSRHAYNFVDCFGELFENIKFIKRKRNYSMKDMAKLSSKRDYTHLIVVNEDKKNINGVTFIHLPEGPTYYFSVSSYVEGKKLSGHGNATSHIPELILKNFNTSLGKSVGNMFRSLFPYQPDIEGRQVITVHNQRDFLFFRRHRYIFRNEEKVGLQELGPQFTLRLRRIQHGIKGDVEWEHKTGMDKEKKKFYL